MRWDNEWRESRGWDTWYTHQDQGGERAAVALALTAGELETLTQAAGLLERLARPRRATCARCGASVVSELDGDQVGELGAIAEGLRAIRGKAGRGGATLWFGQ